MNEELYIYIRTEETTADDDASVDSALWPSSSLTGIIPSSTSGINQVILHFKSQLNYDGYADGNNEIVETDSVNINLTSGISPKQFIREFIEAMNHHKATQKRFFMVGDDLTGNPEYFSKSIADVAGISIQAANS